MMKCILPFCKKTIVKLVPCVVLFALSGCSSPDNSVPALNSPRPTPTIAALFSEQRPTALPVAVFPDETSGSPSAIPSRSSSDEMPGKHVLIYNDTLNGNWSLDHSAGVRYDFNSTRYVDEGRNALAITPTGGEGKLLFTVNRTAEEAYARDRVLGISFRLSGGPNYISNDALSVSLQGSNIYPYWVATDRSVTLKGRVTDKEPVFSETRLYYLNINKDIPPNTWTDVVVWLDDLKYDPDYRYVTGFQIKNDPSFQDTLYIDQVTLIVTK